MKNTLLFIILLMQFNMHSQVDGSALESIVNRYENYFKKDRESVHLHLNKTVFLTGEHIWFSTYGYNQTKNQLDNNKKFVYVDLIKNDGEVVAKRTILQRSGKGQGELFLPNTLESGLYFLQVYTATMQDFEEDDSTKYPILINNLTAGDFSNFDYFKKTEKPEITVSIEGEKLISGIFTNGVVLVHDEKGRTLKPDSIYLKSNKKGVVSKIDIQQFDIGNFSILPQLDENYTVQVFHKGQTYVKKLPNVIQNGVTMAMIRNPNKKEIVVNINDVRLQESSRPALNLLIHKDGYIRGFPILGKTLSGQSQIRIPYEILPEGINTLSLIDESGKNHAERIFWQPSKPSGKKISIAQLHQKNDTIQLSIDTKKSFIDDKDHLSISILPANTKAQRFQKSAFFALHLEPYFSGVKWRNLWLNDFNALNDTGLSDKMMLLAKPKYRWQQIFNENLVTSESTTYTGGIEGIVELKNKKVDPANVMLYSKENEIMSTTEVIDGKFFFEELVLAKGSKLSLSLIGKDGKPHKANFSYTIKPSIPNFRHRFETDDVHRSDEFTEERLEMLAISANTQQLEEVTVVGKKLNYEKFFPGFFGVKVDSTIGMKTLEEFVMKEGFYPMYIDPYFSDLRRAGNTNIGKRNTYCGYVFPDIIFDGVFNPYIDNYLNLSMDYIDEIYFDSPSMCSATFVVFTNENYKSRPINPNKITSKEIIAETGYDSPQPFKRPAYFETNTKSFEHFGILGWQTVTQNLSPEGLFIQIPSDNQSEIRVIIEGITKTGEIISEDRIIALN